MKNINFTDWQDLWLKKDIEGISKKINRSSKFNLCVLIELVIGITTLAVGIFSFIENDEGVIIKENISCLIFILISGSIVIPILVYLISYLIKRKKIMSNIKDEKMDVKEYIDIFDNEICNRIMMANTLCENIAVESKIEAQQYYIGEISYYINKCLAKFNSMQSMSKQIFVENDNKKVAPQRLLLLLKLIIEIRKELNKKIDELMKMEQDGEKINNFILLENKRHDGYFMDFVTYIHINVNKNLGFDKLKI